MANISQFLELTEVLDLNSRRIDRHLEGRRITNILFEYEDSTAVDVTSSQITERLLGMVESVTSTNLQLLPEQFHQLVKLLRESTSDTLRSSMMEVWNCHGNTGDQCNPKHQMLEKDYYLDGLLSCGTPDCITEFTHCLKQGHVSWLTSRFFIYDMAVNHDVSLQVLTGILELCKSRDKISCWLPLSIMINKILNTDMDVSQEDGPVYLTLLHLRQVIGDNCRPGIIQSLPKHRQVEEIDKLLLFLKTLGNIGRPIQTVFDEVNIESKQLVSVILQCAKNTELPKKIAKAAVQALTKLQVDQRIRENLLEITGDINRETVIRTSAFSKLLTTPDAALARELIDLIHNEPMVNMKTYMVASLKSMLENDQPDLLQLRMLWHQAVNEDGRPLSEVQDDLFGKSRYMELSRYFKLPLFVNMSGFQIEFDIVYDPASPVVNSAVVRINRYSGEIHNIFELGIDIEGLDMIMDAVVGKKGMGIYSLLKLLTKARKVVQQQQQQHAEQQEPIFSGFDADVIQQIMSLFDKVNYPKMKIPEGLIHWKLFGNEVLYLEIKDIFQFLMGTESGQQHSGNSRVEQILMTLQQGLAIAKTSSVKHIDLNKVLPTVSGLPLNMTVLVTACGTVDVSVDADILSFMRQVGPITSSGLLSASLTGEFYGQLDVTLSTYYKAGIAMRMSVLANTGLSATADFHMSRPTPHILKNYRLELDIQNVDNQFNVAHIRSKMYHIHNDVTLEILADPDYQTAIRKCYTKIPYLLIGNQLCGNVLYPNVSTSTRHAYFPLSGPFSVDIYLQRADPSLQQFDLDVTYKQLNSTEGYISDKVDMTFTGQGQKLQRTITALILFDRQKRDLTLDAEMPEAQTTFHLRYKHVLGKTLESGTRLYEFIYDVYLNRMSHYLLRTMLQYKRLLTAEETINSLTGEIQPGNRTEQELSLMLAIPVANLQLEFYNMRENLATHFVTELNMTYFCSKTVPLLYMLHLNPKHAALNGDATRIEFSNDVKFGNPPAFWNTTDNMYLKYPGQIIQLTNNMIANQTNAVRLTDITYLDSNQQQKTLKMKAHVENHSDATNLDYDYFMVMKNEDEYDITLQGHVYGNIRHFNLYTDVYFTKVTQDDARRKRSLQHIYDKFEKIEKSLQNRNSEDSQTSESQTEGDNDSESVPVNTDDTRPDTEERRPQSLPYQCRSIFDWDRWNLTLNLTLRVRPVFNPGSRIRIPIGGEYVWNIDLLYPSCNMYKQVLSSGALGRHINNTIFDFRYWINYVNLYKTLVVQQDGTLLTTSSIMNTFDMNVRYQYHQHFDFTLTYRGQSLNGSLKINYQRQTPTYAEITVHFHADSAWMLLNFDHTELYIIQSLTPYGLSNIDHYLKLNHTLFILELNSTLQKTEGEITLHQNGIFMKMIPGVSSSKTAITTDAGFSRTTLPSVSVTFTQPQIVYYVNVGLSHPRLLNITYSFQKNGVLLAPAITGLMEIEGSTSFQYAVSWNPALTTTAKQTFQQKLAGISHMLLDASKTMLLNTQRDIPDIVIPFINKTTGSIVKRIFYPFIMYLPFKGAISESHRTSASENTLHVSSRIKSGKNLLSLIMKFSSDVLKTLGKSIVKPPAVIMPYLNNIIKPRLRQILTDNSVSFVLPLPFKWKHLMSLPEFTQSQKNIQKLIFGIVGKLFRGSRQKTQLLEAESDIALVYSSGKYVSTFDGNVYFIPFSSGCHHNYNGECTYLLTSDFKNKNFALILSNSGISLMTQAMTVTLDFQGRVHINQCTTAVDMPFTSTDNSITVFKNTRGIVLNTNYGVNISCSFPHDLYCLETHAACSITVHKKHRNHTVGLLGTNDGEPGNDLRMPNMTVFANIPKFLTGYALNGPEYCFHSDVVIRSVVCSETQRKSHCKELFENKTSQLVTCFDRVNPDSFLNVCLKDAENCRSNVCDHALAYKILCKSKGLDISIPTLPVNCTRITDRHRGIINKKTLVDIVFVVANDVITRQGIQTVMSHLSRFMESFTSEVASDIQIGAIGYSGNGMFSYGTRRHFIGLKYATLSFSETWIETEDSSIKTMLEMVAGYPFRYNSRRLVILLSKQQIITRDEKRQLIDLYNSKKLRLHVMSKFTELKGRRVLGINYNKKVIFTTRRKKTSNLPKGPLMKVVEQTGGSVLDITPILEGQRARMDHIAKHLMEEVKDFSCQIGA